MKKRRYIGLLAVLLAILLFGCGEAAPITRGIWEGESFSSEFAVISFALPEGFSALSDEALATLVGETADSLYPQGISFVEAAGARASIFDMQAASADGRRTAGLFYENLAFSEMEGISETDYLGMIKTQLDSLSATESANAGEIAEIEFSGKTWYKMNVSLTYGETSVSQCYVVRKIGGFMAVIICSSVDMDAEELLSAFM